MAKDSSNTRGVLLGAGAALAVLGVGLKWARERAARQAWSPGRVRDLGTALVTGASSGIGACFASHLAGCGYALVLVARHQDRLVVVAERLKQQYGVAVEVLAADLTDAADLERVAARVGQLGNLALLVNNAGFGLTGPYAESDVVRQIDMIELHAIASVRLMRAALPGMIARRHGGIINVSSTAAFFTLPHNANYAATKAYLNVFTQSLQQELKGSGVRVQALCPGFTHTKFHDTPESDPRRGIPGFMWMPADTVVTSSLEALARDRVICVPGLGNKLIAAVGRSGLARPFMGLLQR